jgi:ParB family chromosome partitioning protein
MSGAIPLEQLHPNPRNVRDDLGNLDELTASIRAVGLLQPLVVTKRAGGGWTIVDGHRRYQAALIAGAKALPCVARRDAGDETAVMLAAAMHKQLTPLEQARAFDALRRRGLGVADIAARTGYTTATVRGRLDLLGLPVEARRMLERGQLTVTDATELARQVRAAGAGSTRAAVKRSAWFTKSHRLAAVVAESCTHGDDRTLVGGVGCGQCWEAAIRDDAATLGGSVAA